MPDPDSFGNEEAYALYTSYAAELEEAGLTDRFPHDPELRNIAIELLAENHPVEAVVKDPGLIGSAIAEAREIRDERRS